MTRFTDEQRPSSRLSRRDALRLGGMAAGYAGLTSVGPRPRAGAQEQPAAPTIVIPDTGAELPTDDVTFRWLNSGPGPKGVFLQMFFDAYQEAHQNISVLYEQLPWNEISQVVPLGIRNGNAHDVFQVPLNIPAIQAVNEGWVAPLDDIVPNFEEWKASFPTGSFLPGITDFDGKTYTIPMGSNFRYGTLLLYHRGYMERAGFDPVEQPLTWDQFREAARKITELGQGEYFGLIFEGDQTGRYEEWVRNLARMAGASAGVEDIDWRTGEFVYTSEQYIAAVELLLAMRDDGSIFPGSLSLNAHDARARMTEGVAGMILQGPWNIPTWQQDAPGFDFGVASQPIPNEGAPLPLTVGPGAGNFFWIFADSPHKAIAGDVFAYLGTLEGQTAWASVVGIADPPNMPEALAAADLDERSRVAADLFQSQLRTGPDTRVRNPETVQFYLEQRPVTPDFGTTVQGLLAGQLDDVREAMQDLQDRTEAEFERAIAAAQEAGAQISRDDFVFANWDPTRDYTEADYAAL